MGKMIDITNQRFGKLVVLENAGKLDGRHYFWKCQCDCGKIITIEGSRLRSGNTKSCGCGRYDGLKKYNEEQSEKSKIPLGTKFGKLTVVEDLGLRPQLKGCSRRWYKCICECGNIKEVQGNLLKQEQALSCGKCISSKGEYQIIQILDKLNILYDYDTIYLPLYKETGRKLRFDFIIYNEDGSINRCIEFDGRQHYTGPDTTYWGHGKDTKKTIQEKDQIKNNFCIKHNIPLVRIPYWIKPTEDVLFGKKYLIKGMI